jgi:ribosomal protein S27E
MHIRCEYCGHFQRVRSDDEENGAVVCEECGEPNDIVGGV